MAICGGKGRTERLNECTMRRGPDYIATRVPSSV
jgi:hypothetical protein